MTPVPLRRTTDGALAPDWGRVPARVYAAGLAGAGRRTMTACLEAIADWLSGGDADIDTFAWASLRFSHTTALRAALGRAVTEGRYAPATANKHLAALRGALKMAWRMEMMTTDDYLRAVDLRPIAGSRLPAGRDVAHGELDALLATCGVDDRPAGIRDGAVIALAYLSGLRRGELAALQRADVDVDPPALRVIGKGGKERLVPLSPTVGPFLEAWLELRGDSPGPFFCPIDRAGTLRLPRAMTGEAIRQLLGRRRLAAGLAAMSPHDFAAPTPATCSTPAPISPPCSSCSATPPRPPHRDTTVEATGPAGRRPSDSTSWSPRPHRRWTKSRRGRRIIRRVTRTSWHGYVVFRSPGSGACVVANPGPTSSRCSAQAPPPVAILRQMSFATLMGPP